MLLEKISGSVVIDEVNSTIALSGPSIAKATKPIFSGKYYWEITVNSVKGSTFALLVGIANPEYTGFNTYSYFKYAYMAQKFSGPGPSRTDYGSTFKAGDTISILLDASNKTIEFWKNGVTMGVAFTGINAHENGIVPILQFWNSSTGNGGTMSVNLTKKSFKYTIPDGYHPYDIGDKYMVVQDGEFKTYSDGWLIISSELPDAAQFMELGIDILERSIVNLDAVPMNRSSSSTKKLTASIDLRDRTNIKTVKIEVK